MVNTSKKRKNVLKIKLIVTSPVKSLCYVMLCHAS